MDQSNMSVWESGHASNRDKLSKKHKKKKQVVEEVSDVIVELNYQGEKTNIEDTRASVATAVEVYVNNGDGDGEGEGDGNGEDYVTATPLTKPIRRSRKNRDPVALVTRCLGIEAMLVENEFEKNNGFYLRLDWIKKQMSRKEAVPDDSGDEEDENYYEKAKANVNCMVHMRQRLKIFLAASSKKAKNGAEKPTKTSNEHTTI